ncbi:MAG: hypothetical protein ACP5QZ_09915 [Candidatus Sumerlaeaceae bacterium]
MIRRHAIAALFGFLTLYVATSGGHLYSPDEEIMFRMTESLARRGALSVEPMLDPQGRSFATRRGVDGKEYAQYGIGNSLFAVPLYWLGDFAARHVSPEKAEATLGFRTVMYVPETERQAGPALVRRFAVSFFGSIVGAATCALLWIFAYRAHAYFFCQAADEKSMSSAKGPANGDLPPPAVSPCDQINAAHQVPHPPSPSSFAVSNPRSTTVAWLTTLAYGAGTMALPHARTFFSEPLATFFTLASFFAVFGGKRLSIRRTFVAGVAFALALLTRLDSAVVAPALGLYLVLRFLETESAGDLYAHQLDVQALLRYVRTRRFLCVLVAFCVGPLIFAAVHIWLNWLHFGNPFTSAYADQPEGIRFRTPLLAGLYGYFMSIGKSVFLFSPAIVFGLAGWRTFGRRIPSLAFCFALAVALLLVFHSRWQNWAGGWCWGPRHIFMAHAFVMLPAVGFFANWNRVRRLIFVMLMPIAFGVQLYGASQNFIDFYILYYRTPETQPNAYVLYSNEDLKPIRAIAPINDSIYVPQNSQWYRYAEMWQLGYTDNLWLRLWDRAREAEPPVR